MDAWIGNPLGTTLMLLVFLLLLPSASSFDWADGTPCSHEVPSDIGQYIPKSHNINLNDRTVKIEYCMNAGHPDNSANEVYHRSTNYFVLVLNDMSEDFFVVTTQCYLENLRPGPYPNEYKVAKALRSHVQPEQPDSHIAIVVAVLKDKISGEEQEDAKTYVCYDIVKRYVGDSLPHFSYEQANKETKLRLVKELVKGFQEFHDLGIFDLKIGPEDVVLDKHYALKIDGFKSAMYMGTIIHSGIAVPSYSKNLQHKLPPEHKVSELEMADTWFIGLMILEIYLGPIEYIKAIKGGGSSRKALLNLLPKNIRKLAEKCLNKKSKERPSTEEILAEIKRIESNVPPLRKFTTFVHDYTKNLFSK